MALFFGYTDILQTKIESLKTWIDNRFQKKQKWKLNTVMTWYYADKGGYPIALNGNTFPMTSISNKTMVKIICHSFDKHGVVPDNKVTVDYRLYYITRNYSNGSELLGSVTLKDVNRHYNGHYSAPVNKCFYITDTISKTQSDNQPSTGFIYITFTGLTAGNENCLTVAIYEPADDDVM